jgi:hypothetical protein
MSSIIIPYVKCKKQNASQVSLRILDSEVRFLFKNGLHVQIAVSVNHVSRYTQILKHFCDYVAENVKLDKVSYFQITCYSQL